jgi:hypothetical protein
MRERQRRLWPLAISVGFSDERAAVQAQTDRG